MTDGVEESEYEISRSELRELLDEISAQGVEQLKRNPPEERPYLHGQGAGLTNAAAYIARHFDLDGENDE